MSGAWLALLALAIAAATLAHYATTVRAVRVALRPRAHQAGLAAAALLAVAALANGPGWLGGVAAALALAVAALFFALTAISGLPRGAIAVAVGAPALDFTASDADGRSFALSSLRGQRILLKFFRGHW
jgi:hypothetical protein